MSARKPAGTHLEQIEVGSAEDLRDWLGANSHRTESVWIVSGRKGKPGYVAASDFVDEALCFGWIDSLPRKLDEARTMRLLSPRRRGSAWSKVNKEKAEKLIAEGRMTAAGQARIDEAKTDGSWDALNEVDALLVPADLAAALAAVPAAAGYFAAFPPSSRRGILEWIGAAKTPETRARRIADTVAKASRNIKANHPAGRDAGPGGIVPEP